MLNEREMAALGALLQARSLFDMVLLRFDWGAEFLGATDIHRCTRALTAVCEAIELLTKRDTV